MFYARLFWDGFDMLCSGESNALSIDCGHDTDESAEEVCDFEVPLLIYLPRDLTRAMSREFFWQPRFVICGTVSFLSLFTNYCCPAIKKTCHHLAIHAIVQSGHHSWEMDFIDAVTLMSYPVSNVTRLRHQATVVAMQKPIGFWILQA
jgi:hypothetical protein